jgi:hypothetical protein
VVLDVYSQDVVFAYPLLPDFGYWVGTEAITAEDLLDMYHPIVVGIWTADDKTVHLDRSVWVQDLDVAETLGRRCNQQAIWDCANKVVIYL